MRNKHPLCKTTSGETSSVLTPTKELKATSKYLIHLWQHRNLMAVVVVGVMALPEFILHNKYWGNVFIRGNIKPPGWLKWLTECVSHCATRSILEIRTCRQIVLVNINILDISIASNLPLPHQGFQRPGFLARIY